MFLEMTRRVATLLGAVTLAAGASTPLQAQTAGPAQYVVTYGELAPNHDAEHSALSLFAELTRLARNSGAQYFSVNMEIERPNRFTFIEVWRDAASYSTFASASNVQQVLRYLQPLLIAPLDERDGNFVTPSQTD